MSVKNDHKRDVKRPKKAKKKARPIISNAAKNLSVEAQFAQKLAHPEPTMRDRAVKKLRSWLRSRGSDLGEDEILRIWKGLFYCFWMSDKPLVQEELAEKISAMVHCFEAVPDTATDFISGFSATMGWEWVGLDRFRLDKFMMLIRRFMRQTFVFAKKANWSGDVIDKVTKIVSSDAMGAEAKAALGFQLHVTDVFLEELAKVGGEELSHEVVNSFLRPFVNELKVGRDERLREQIEERIFRHLMRQTDEGIAYEESGLVMTNGYDSGSEDEGDDDDHSADDADGDLLEQDSEEEHMEEEEGADDVTGDVKDPRAGGVDVTIPQLQIDCAALAEALFEAGGEKGVGHAQRAALYRLTKQFKSLADGRYPLGVDASELENDGDGEKLPSVANLARERMAAEMKDIAKRREERKQYRLSLKRKRGTESKKEGSDDSEAEEEMEQDRDTSGKKVEEKIRNPQKAKKFVADKKAKKADQKAKKRKVSLNNEKAESEKPKNDTVDASSSVAGDKESEDVRSEKSPVKEKNQKQKKKKKKKNQSKPTKPDSSAPQSEEGGVVASPVISVTKAPSPKNKKSAKTPNKFEEKQPKKGIDGYSAPKISSEATPPTPVFVRKALSKRQRMNNSFRETPKKEQQEKAASPTTTTPRKKLTLAMSYNKFQTVLEHSRSVEASPEIPFSPARRPRTQGLLKNKVGDPSIVNLHTLPQISKGQIVAKNTIKNSKSKAALVVNRMRAHDFF